MRVPKGPLASGGSRTILLSKRANILYLDRVRVMSEGERVVFRMRSGNEWLDYNLPDCNTSLLLLGKGSSITDAAARMLAKSSVVVGFCGTGGAPLHSAVDFVFLNPQDEYRPTEYAQEWIKLWLNQDRKMAAARQMQKIRAEQTLRCWAENDALLRKKVELSEEKFEKYLRGIHSAESEQDFLLEEARWSKGLYGDLAKGFGVSGFLRKPGEGADDVNSLLDHANYLMYGLAAVSLHALGIPAAFPLIHGKTRRGGLVFDVADLWKDGIAMPMAFDFGTRRRAKDSEFREALIKMVQKEEVLDNMIESIKKVIEKNSL